MDNRNIIMLFLDLEGTIIDEETGNMQEEKLNSFFTAISELEENTGAKVNLHIVSPVFINVMEKVIDKLDEYIVKYNIQSGKRLKDVQGAVAYPDIDYITSHDLYDRIFPMNISHKEHSDRYGKLDYVRKWVEGMQDRILLTIYGGNGLNDTGAMDFVKRENNGFAICPANSHEKVKTIANYISEKEETDGITDGINFINEQIRKRKQIDKENQISDDDGR